MLAGAVVATEKSTYTDDNFETNKELITFSLENIDELPHKIRLLLFNIEEAIKNAEKGYIRANAC